MNILDIEFAKDVEIKSLTTLKTSGTLRGVFYPKNEKEIKFLIKYMEDNNIKYFILGNGSNLLISPETDNYAISTKKMAKKLKKYENLVEFTSSVMLPTAFIFCKTHNLSGLEQLSSIPATIGGAIKNNASCYGKSISDDLVEIKVIKEGKMKHLKKSDICFGYHSTNLNRCVVLSATFKFKKSDASEIEKKRQEALASRRENQPIGLSAGSTFKNPNGHSAGKLIEGCDLKGRRSGDAVISSKHANFIINEGRATFSNIKSLIDICEEEILAKYNIPLEREIEIIE